MCAWHFYTQTLPAQCESQRFGISNDSSMRSCFSRRWINLGRPGKAGLWPVQFTGIYESKKNIVSLGRYGETWRNHGETLGCWVHSLFSSKPIECSFQKLIMVETPSAKTCQQTKHLMWKLMPWRHQLRIFLTGPIIPKLVISETDSNGIKIINWGGPSKQW